MNKKRFWFIFLLVSALAVRIAILYFIVNAREHTDILRYKDWARIAFLYGYADTYSSTHLQFGTLPNNLPPGMLYILSFMYMIGIQISKLILSITHSLPGSIIWLNVTLITLLFRIPAIVSDLVIGIFIYKIIRNSTKNFVRPFIGMGLFLFNPIVLYNSTVWGQMDAVVNVFFIASLYAYIRKNIFPSMLLFLFCLFIKLSLVYFLPVYIILWWKHVPWKRFLYYVAAVFSLGFILILPVSINPILWLTVFLKNNAIGEMTNITAYAFNMWWMIFHPLAIPQGIQDSFNFSIMNLQGSPSDSLVYFGISLFWWACIAFILFVIPVLYRLIKKEISTSDMTRSLFIVSLLAFLLLPRMHERYMYPVFPLLAILASGSGWYCLGFAGLSILHFVNIYIVWHPVELLILPYTLWGQRSVQWFVSVFIVFISAVFYISYITHGDASLTKKNKK